MSRPKKPIIMAVGRWGTVECALTANGECPAEDFFNDLAELREKSKDDPQSTAKHRFAQLFQQMANYGSVSPKRFGPEMHGLYAFKHEVRNIQVRFACFPDGPSRWVLTHGFQKPGAKKGRGKWPVSEIKRALDIRKEYLR